MSKGFLIDGYISFEPENYKLIINDMEVRLSQKECQVLEILCRNYNVVVERCLFLEPIWGSSASGDIGLNKAILLLRRKFESHERPNLINTIPRVGYTLNASVTELSYTEDGTYQDSRPTIKLVDADADADSKTYNTKKTARAKVTFAISLASIVIFLVATKNTTLFTEGNEPSIISKVKTGNSITYSSIPGYDIPFLNKTNSSTSKENNIYFRALLSSSMLSFILYKNSKPINQKVFLIERSRNIKEQLTCVDDYLSKNINTNDDATKDLIDGMMYSTKKFYSYCHKNTTSELAILYVKGTRLAHGSDENHMMLQDFKLKTSTGKDIFHIKRYVNHLGFGTDHMKFVQKSIVSDSIDINLIHTNELYSELLAGLTKDEVSHIRIEPQLYVSENLNGMLFYSKDYH
ncbi:winged helix-turn-helix domain-containing protein [Aeromonas piscicola]|uniref:winged helix-turn-helix domain-containing protein n=1 Tax=Aeromonas piscicola TaxID=600645 RepID=UPI0021F87389|nr:winged helix-turn-helix domain-containing protein [Aeromonas piscicola]MCW0504510.1 winged helix-turn-helix domain-containing protein [Aeromonas piscicola]